LLGSEEHLNFRIWTSLLGSEEGTRARREECSRRRLDHAAGAPKKHHHHHPHPPPHPYLHPHPHRLLGFDALSPSGLGLGSGFCWVLWAVVSNSIILRSRYSHQRFGLGGGKGRVAVTW